MSAAARPEINVMASQFTHSDAELPAFRIISCSARWESEYPFAGANPPNARNVIATSTVVEKPAQLRKGESAFELHSVSALFGQQLLERVRDSQKEELEYRFSFASSGGEATVLCTVGLDRK